MKRTLNQPASDSNEGRPQHFIVTNRGIIKNVFLLPSREKGSGYY